MCAPLTDSATPSMSESVGSATLSTSAPLPGGITSAPVTGCATPSMSKSAPLSGSATSTSASASCSPFSNLLNLPCLSTPVMPKTGKACVLTNSECFKLMKDKEGKKKEASCDGKEKRKRERELKKKEKEDGQKRTAAEKACKTAEREAEKVRKETEKAERTKEKARKVQEKSVKTGQKRSSHGSDKENSSRPKRKQQENDMDTVINTDECCFCLGTYYLEDMDISDNGQNVVVADGCTRTVWIVRILTTALDVCVLFVNECEFICSNAT